MKKLNKGLDTSKLVKKTIIDKTGKKTTKWVKPGDDKPASKTTKKTEVSDKGNSVKVDFDKKYTDEGFREAVSRVRKGYDDVKAKLEGENLKPEEKKQLTEKLGKLTNWLKEAKSHKESKKETAGAEGGEAKKGEVKDSKSMAMDRLDQAIESASDADKTTLQSFRETLSRGNKEAALSQYDNMHTAVKELVPLSIAKDIGVELTPKGEQALKNEELIGQNVQIDGEEDNWEVTRIDGDKIYVKQERPNRGVEMWVKEADLKPAVEPKEVTPKDLKENGLVKEWIGEDFSDAGINMVRSTIAAQGIDLKERGEGKKDLSGEAYDIARRINVPGMSLNDIQDITWGLLQSKQM